MAIYRAFNVAIEDGLTKLVFTHSLLGKECTDGFVVAYIHRLFDNANIEKLDVVWLPSHMGISFNEEVDNIARAAVDVSAPISPNFMRYNVKRERSYFLS